MRHDEGQLTGHGEIRLYYQRWLPDNSPVRAVIVMLHGDFAHSGWYMNLPEHEAPRGYAVYAYDRRGWGRSGGQRGYISQWDEHLDDLRAFMEVVRQYEPGSPVSLMGHTGSTSIVLEYALRYPQEIRGVFCIAPTLSTGGVIPAPLRLLLRGLSKVVPRLPINARRRFEAQSGFISRDQAFVSMILHDPLAHMKVTPRWLTETEKAMQHVAQQPDALRVPLLFLIGGADRNSFPEASKAFFQNVPFSDKELHEYPGAYTNLLSETNYEEVLADIDRWLDRHL